MLKFNSFHIIGILCAAALKCTAEAPAPDKLLPADTLAVVTVKDFARTQTVLKQAPLARLWNDPAMLSFRKKFDAKFKAEVTEPFEKRLGVKFADYTPLAQGQITLAVIQDGWTGQESTLPAWVLLLDSKNESTNLTARLSELRKKWTDMGKQLKSEKVRGVELTTLFIKPEELALSGAQVPGSEEAKSSRPIEVIVGQSNTLLLMGSSLKVLEKVLVRQSGGALPGLNEQPAFEGSDQSILRGSLAYGWGNVALLYDVIAKMALQQSITPQQPSPMGLSPAKALSVSGLAGLQTVSAGVMHSADGNLFALSLGAPTTKREGLLKLLALETKECSPPPFIPSAVTKFRRWRLDGQKMWSSLEAMIAQISPQLSGVLQMSLGALGKDQDPNFDFKKSFIANLGDDMISMEKPPRTNSPEELYSPPSLFLIGSPKPDQLVQAIRAATALVPSATGEGLKEREFQGRKIYSLALPPLSGPQGGRARVFLFAASGSYVAMSSDDAFLEEYLRSPDTTAKPLREASGLSESAQRVGGFGPGMFGYDNRHDTMKFVFEEFRNGGGSLEKLFGDAPLGERPEVDESLKEWFDFTALPPFEKIEKYFYHTVFAGGVDDRGFSAKFFVPTPPKLKTP